jgi:hypothetical protein
MVTHAHAAEPDRRNFQVAVSKFALLHFLTPVSTRPSASDPVAALGIVRHLSDSCWKAVLR